MDDAATRAASPGLLDRVAWPVLTPRLSLRRAEVADAEAIWDYRHRPEVTEWITAEAGPREGYAAAFATPERLAVHVVVERRAAPGVVGDLMVRPAEVYAQREVGDQAAGTSVELGWVLHPDHQGRGYAGEAVAAALRLCFEDLGLRRVTAYCFADNAPSWRLMERLGMRREAHNVADSLHRTRGWLDGYGYAMLAVEWPASAAARLV